MSSIDQIPYEDIVIFLEANDKKLSEDRDENNKLALKLLSDRKAKGHTTSIIEWMMAHNLLINKVDIPNYTIYEIDHMQQAEINKLAKLLTMEGNNRNNIKGILKYLGKLMDVSYNNLPNEVIYNLIINTEPLDLENLYVNKVYRTVIDNPITLNYLYDKYKNIVKNQQEDYRKYTGSNMYRKRINNDNRTNINKYSEDIYTVKSFNNLLKIYKNYIQSISGLAFDIFYIYQLFGKWGMKLDIKTIIKITTTLEYLTAEILEVAGNEILKNYKQSKKDTMVAYDIEKAIRNDEELIETFNNLIVKVKGSGFDNEIRRVFNQINPDMKISSQAIQLINSLLYDFLRQIFEDISKFKSFEELLNKMLYGELNKHAKSEYIKVLGNFNNDEVHVKL